MKKETLHIIKSAIKKKNGTIIERKTPKGTVRDSYVAPSYTKKRKPHQDSTKNPIEIDRYKDIFLKKFYNDIKQYKIDSHDEFVEKLKKSYSNVYEAIKRNKYHDAELDKFLHDYESLDAMLSSQRKHNIQQEIELFKDKLNLHLEKYGYLTKHLKTHIKYVFRNAKIKKYVGTEVFDSIIRDAILNHNIKEFEKIDIKATVDKLKSFNLIKVLPELNQIIPNFDPDDINILTHKFLNKSFSEVMQYRKENLFKSNNTSLTNFNEEFSNLKSFDSKVLFLKKYKKLYDTIISDDTYSELQDIIKNYFDIQKQVYFYSQLKENIENRDISLFHFTRKENIPSILKYGLLSVYQLKRRDIPFYYNDTNRWDNKLNCICCSISFPNVRLLHTYYDRVCGKSYVIFELNRNILLDKKCFICSQNAARDFGDNIEVLDNIKEFDSLFENKTTKYPINIQTEVLVREYIEVKYIKCVHVYSNIEYTLYKKLYPNLKFTISPELFTYRLK